MNQVAVSDDLFDGLRWVSCARNFRPISITEGFSIATTY